jgi:hypothetical protein
MNDEMFQLPDDRHEPGTLPSPPTLHWAWVLVLSLITGFIFYAVWLFIQARWVRKVRGTSNAYGWSFVYILFAVIENAGDLSGHSSDYVHGAILILYLVTGFLLKGELEDPEIGLSLSSTMTFFFGAIYFQYFLRDV